MKRHPALQDLSRDHHLVLIKCQLLRRAIARSAPATELREIAEDILAFYESDMLPHFEEEDRVVVPAAVRTKNRDLVEVARTVHGDHGWFRERFRRLGASVREGKALGEILTDLEPRLTAHVRIEEESLFEGVQRELREAKMQALWKESYAFRSAHRAPSACHVRPPLRPTPRRSTPR